ncbi:MAG: hypoxanthine phosphoribosyltransferase [Phycisphaerales bacterium]
MEREHRVLIGRERIASRVAQIGRALAQDLAAEPQSDRVVLVPILTGSMVFVADLIRHIPLKMSIRPVTLSSYPGQATQSQGVTLRGEIPTDLAGAHVVVIDDILDSGRTLGLLKRMIQAQRPASIRLCVLLSKRKPSGRDEEISVDFAGFEIDDEFVVGYGLDYDGYFRNLPDIVTLSPESS